MKRLHSLAILPMLLLGGCPDAGPPSQSSQLPRTTYDDPGPPIPADATRPTTASLLPETGPTVVVLDVYQLQVPLGAVSRNDEFWKHVEESMIDAGTYDVMLKNDMRVGVGDNRDWPFFKNLIDQYHATAMKGSSSPTQLGSLELPMRRQIESEDIFWWDDHDVCTGRTFEQCDNILTVSFEPHHRKLDHTVIKVCPLIRGKRKRLEFTVRNGEREIKVTQPEQIFQMALEADIPPAHFLILAPPRDSRFSLSAGHTFLVNSGIAEQLETVLILAPRTMHLAPLH